MTDWWSFAIGSFQKLRRASGRIPGGEPTTSASHSSTAHCRHRVEYSQTTWLEHHHNSRQCRRPQVTVPSSATSRFRSSFIPGRTHATYISSFYYSHLDSAILYPHDCAFQAKATTSRRLHKHQRRRSHVSPVSPPPTLRLTPDPTYIPPTSTGARTLHHGHIPPWLGEESPHEPAHYLSSSRSRLPRK